MSGSASPERGCLSGVRVLDCGRLIAAPFCAELLLGMGAEVTKAEKPQGDELRYRGPFVDDLPGQDRSALFHYVNAGKKGVTLNLKTAKGQELLHEIVAQMDVIVEDNPPSQVAELSLDYQSLHKVNPRLIVTSITPFGHTGPRRDWLGTDLVMYHMSTLGYATPGLVADPSKDPPIRAAS